MPRCPLSRRGAELSRRPWDRGAVESAEIMTAPRWSGAGSGAGGLRAPRRRPCPKGELQQTRGRHAVLGHVSPRPPPSLLLRRWPPSLQTLRVSALPSAASTSCESDTAIQGSPQAHCGPTPEHDRIPGSGLGPSEPALPQCRLLSSPSTTTVSVRTGKPDDFLFRVYGIVG